MNPASIQAIVLDLDGTLLSTSKTILPYTKKVLNTLEKQGTRLIFASGRGYGSVQPFAHSFFSRLPLILFNGSVILDPTTANRLKTLKLDAKIVHTLYESTRNTPLRMHLYTQDQVFLDMEDEQKYRMLDPVAYRNCQSIEGISFTRNPFIKAMITGDQTDTLGWEIINNLIKIHPGAFYPVSTFKNHIEIMNPKANKKHGLQMVSERCNIPFSNMLAFGDADNDIEMLQSVQWGVAMGNASDTLKLHADAITDDNDHDGIGIYLARMFNL